MNIRVLVVDDEPLARLGIDVYKRQKEYVEWSNREVSLFKSQSPHHG